MVNRSFLTLDDKPLSGKTVFVRVDLNCPVDEKTKKPQLSPRITAHARTVLDLSLSGAKTVLLAHQGRAGDDDFTSLEFHAKLLQKEVAKLAKKTGEKAASGEKKSAPGEKKPAPKIKFVDDVCGEKSKGAIKALKAGEVILLQNVRYLDDETKFEKNGGKSELVSNLSQFCDIFVLDAFSCAHRAHASVVGFSSKPCLAGRVMAQELGALESFHNPKPPVVFVMGGAKPDDSLPILASWLEAKKLDYALCGGVLGSLMLLASGRKLGETEEFLAKKEVLVKLDDARALIAKYSKQIVLPIDMVVDDKGKAKILEVSELPSLNSISDGLPGCLECTPAQP